MNTSTLLRLVSLVLLAALVCGAGSITASMSSSPPAQGWDELNDRAERLYAEGAYAEARALYKQAVTIAENSRQRRWAEFREADARWRAAAAGSRSDSGEFDAARKGLEAQVQAIERVEDRDDIWALTNESIGDFWWVRYDSRSMTGWSYYTNALDYWAGSSDLEQARRRYLDIVFRLADPAWADDSQWQMYGNINIEHLENAVRIAVDPADQAHANYIYGVAHVRRGSGPNAQARAVKALETAIELGRGARWHDDALYLLAEWLTNQGVQVVEEDGTWTQKPDHVRALELYRRLTKEYSKGESRYFDHATQRISEITSPALEANVSNFFLPNSEVQVHVRWRNVPRIDFAVHRLSLVNDMRFEPSQTGPGEWMEALPTSGLEKVREWSRETKDDGTHQPGELDEHIQEKLAPGAYVFTATAGGKTARELILVTDASITIKASRDKVVTWGANAVTSAPLSGCTVRLWAFKWNSKTDRWGNRSVVKTADERGLCVFTPEDFGGELYSDYNYFAAVESGQSAAFAASSAGWYGANEGNWRIYAYTDRPAYRPEDVVHWKVSARVTTAHGYVTPSGQSLEYRIRDPRGTTMKEGTLSLNDFGSAWSEFELGTELPLGEYHVMFWSDKAKKRQIGQASLFRLEEYKLPEFQVTVKTPEQDGTRMVYRLGEVVEATIDAVYYFGGPVANATVEVRVHQSPYYHWWRPRREYGWFYQDENPYRWWGSNEQVIKQVTLKTDSAGRAKVTFETPEGQAQAMQYRIEARVVDASRREVTGSATLRVMYNRYMVRLEPEHMIHRPQDRVEITVHAEDANGQGTSVEGKVKVTREVWEEIWYDPSGEEIYGAKLDALRAAGMFPPPSPPNLPPWRIKRRGYKSEPVELLTVNTNAEGKGTVSFVAPRTGYFKILWTSKDPGAVPVQTETYVWVTTADTTMLSYNVDGLDILADKDTFRAGQTAPVMISTPVSDRHVLFTVEGNYLYSHEVVHVSGTVKLVNIPIDQRHVPNVWLTAGMPTDGRWLIDTQEIVIPPVEQFITVEVTPDKSEYEPQQEGTFVVRTTDADSKPVSAEVALGVSDESVYYIQQDLAGDPRQFFHQQRQNLAVQTGTSFNQRAYVRMVKMEDGRVVDERERDRLLALAEDESDLDDNFGVVREGVERKVASLRGGRGFGGVAMDAAGYRDTAAAPRSAVAANAEFAGAEDKMHLGIELGQAPPPAPPSAPGEPAGEEPAVVVRSDFRSTIVWEPGVVTDADGLAIVKVKYADSLTGWRATARAIGRGSQVGMATATVRTRLPLIARLQAPRFFVVGDETVISGVMNNNTSEAMEVLPSLEASGLTVLGVMRDGQITNPDAAQVTIPANGDARIDWLVRAESHGSAKLTFTAKGATHADAMVRSYPIHEHGVERFIAKSGKVRGNEITLAIDLPRDRRANSESLVVQVTPSLAVTMLDSLPYLIDYPYGCTEQTMSRFLPAAITARTLGPLKLDPETAMNRVFGGIEQATAGKTHPKGKKNLEQLSEMINAGIERLRDFQHADGGWGWWKDGESDHYMTAYVLWGLALAHEAGMDVPRDMGDRAAAYIDVELVEEEGRVDLQAWMLQAMAHYRAATGNAAPTNFQRTALNNIWAKRGNMSAYTTALAALAAHHMSDDQKAKAFAQNLSNGVNLDDRPDASIIVKGAIDPADNAGLMATAHWGEARSWRHWSDGGVETTAWALMALMQIDPQSALIEPAMNWLVKNRRGAQWSNTRDTAMVVLAMNAYLARSGELNADLSYELFVNGTSVTKQHVKPADVLAAPSRFVIDPKLLRDGMNEVRIVRGAGANESSTGAIYFATELTFFSQEEPIPASGNEIFVRREYFKLVPKPTLLKGYTYERVPIADGGDVASGERVEVLLTIEAKNNYEYLVFEDLKAAGIEAAALQSGSGVTIKEIKNSAVQKNFATDGNASAIASETAHTDVTEYTGRSRWVYQELRDRHVALFIDQLPQGVWQIRYEMRAEVPGRFHALPVLGHAMYVPEIRCNGAEHRISVTEARDVVISE